MTKDYELPKGRRITVDFDENEISKVTVQALDSLIGELNYYADKVCDIEQIRAEIESLNPVDYVSMSSYEGHRGASDMKEDVLQIIDKHIGERSE